MNILYVDQTGQLGGGEIALLPWLERNPEGARMVLLEDGPFRPLLERAGVAVEVLALETVKSVRRESGVLAVLRAVPAFMALRRQMRRAAKRADLIYANSQKAFLLAAFSKRVGQPLVWHLRDILTAEHFSALLRRLAVLVGNRFASVVIANSRATAEAFVAAGGRRDRVTVVHDGVDAATFDLVDEQGVSTLRESLGAQGKSLVGIFGRLAEWKGQHVLLEAVAGLPDVHAVLVGDALFGEHTYVQRLKDRAAQPDLAGRVHFLGFQREIPRLMKGMDVVAHCSIAPEPFGLVIVEAMLARRPVIATRAGGALEILEHGQSGLLVAPGDVPELIDAIRALLDDPAGAQSMAQIGRCRAEVHFSIDALNENIHAVLAGLPTGPVPKV